MAEVCREFCDKWGLDDEARKRANELRPDQLQRVVTEFKGDAGTGNVNAFFHAFLNQTFHTGGIVTGGVAPSMMNAQIGMTGPSPEQVQAFIQACALDSGAANMIRNSSPQVQQVALNHFKPGQSTNTSAQLVAYLKNLTQNGVQVGGQSMTNSQAGIAGPSNEEIQAFVQRCGLDSGAANMIRNSSPQLQQIALLNFNPGRGGNVNAQFVAYLKKLPSFAAGKTGTGGGMQNPMVEGSGMTNPQSGITGPSNEEVQAFLKKWQVSDDAAAYLMRMPPEVKAQVLRTFNPPADTRNISGRLVAFIKGARDTIKPQEVDPMQMQQMQIQQQIQQMQLQMQQQGALAPNDGSGNSIGAVEGGWDGGNTLVPNNGLGNGIGGMTSMDGTVGMIGPGIDVMGASGIGVGLDGMGGGMQISGTAPPFGGMGGGMQMGATAPLMGGGMDGMGGGMQMGGAALPIGGGMAALGGGMQMGGMAPSTGGGMNAIGGGMPIGGMAPPVGSGMDSVNPILGMPGTGCMMPLPPGGGSTPPAKTINELMRDQFLELMQVDVTQVNLAVGKERIQDLVKRFVSLPEISAGVSMPGAEQVHKAEEKGKVPAPAFVTHVLGFCNEQMLARLQMASHQWNSWTDQPQLYKNLAYARWPGTKTLTAECLDKGDFKSFYRDRHLLELWNRKGEIMPVASSSKRQCNASSIAAYALLIQISDQKGLIFSAVVDTKLVDLQHDGSMIEGFIKQSKEFESPPKTFERPVAFHNPNLEMSLTAVRHVANDTQADPSHGCKYICVAHSVPGPEEESPKDDLTFLFSAQVPPSLKGFVKTKYNYKCVLSDLQFGPMQRNRGKAGRDISGFKRLRLWCEADLDDSIVEKIPKSRKLGEVKFLWEEAA